MSVHCKDKFFQNVDWSLRYWNCFLHRDQCRHMDRARWVEMLKMNDWLTANSVLTPPDKSSIQATTQDTLSAITIYNLLRILLAVGVFLSSSKQQHTVHKYLASLKDYRVPDHPIFEQTNTICPHYGAEVNIYLALAILTAQSTRMFNLTMICALGFVVVNLGITADLTKQWQLAAFPKNRMQIAGRKRMMALWWSNELVDYRLRLLGI